MELPSPDTGLVIRYGYLWSHEADAGAETASKSRPCAIVVATALRDGDLLATVVPITHRQPPPEANAVELPVSLKTRLGLDSERSWVVTHETNVFRWPGPDLERIAGEEAVAYGRLTRNIYEAVRTRLLAHARSGRLRLTKRTE